MIRVSNSSAVNVGVALRGHPIVDFFFDETISTTRRTISRLKQSPQARPQF
jgi:hypothetical protein